MDTENKLRISEDFRNRLIELLQEDGGKKKDIAMKMNVDFRSLSNAYNFGIIPKPSTLMKMADYFNVSIDFLLGRSDNDTFSNLIILSVFMPAILFYAILVI